jgi:hypothetical protein
VHSSVFMVTRSRIHGLRFAILPFIRLSLKRAANKRDTVSNTNCWKLSNRFRSFCFWGNDRAITLGPYNCFVAGS